MSAPPPRQISAAHARRFLVRRHLLDPARSLPAQPSSVLKAIERLGSFQFDPLEVPGARNHDLVLHARIKGYRREWCDHWLYAPRSRRRLIELYNKALNILPIEELPWYRLAWTRSQPHYRDFLREHAALADRIRTHIRDEGPVSTAAFADHDQVINWWWDTSSAATTRAARAVLEAMFVSGEIGIARREGSRRFYDLIERLVPAQYLDAPPAPEAEAWRHRVLSRYRAVGLVATTGNAELVWGQAGSVAQRKVITMSLIDEGVLVPVEVEGRRGVRLVMAEELPILEATARRSRRPPTVSFLAPLDPLMWDRPMLRDLFDFDYLWEVYTPEAKRRHGYYVLPILFGDRFAGRLEPKLDRKRRQLDINGVWFEDGFEPMSEPGFIPALAEALRAYRSFIGADVVTWPRSRIGRDLARAVAVA
ncbi:MAG TPA: crosslink repair DNA glycosylase YcaQ family protein [Candidatus Limnocylindria bacterium]